MESLEKELNQNIYSSNNVIKKIPKKKKIKRVHSTNNYSAAKVKARKLLTNVSHNRVKEADFQNRSFVIDCYSFKILYLYPFYLERKFKNSIDRDYVNAMWNLMMPATLYNFIYQEENFKTLNKLKLKFEDTSEIIKTFLDDNSQLEILKDYLIKYANHTSLFMEIYFQNILRELMIMVLKVKPILIIFTRAIYLKNRFLNGTKIRFLMFKIKMKTIRRRST